MDKSIVEKLTNGDTVLRTIEVKNSKELKIAIAQQVSEILKNDELISYQVHKQGVIHATFIKESNGDYYFLKCIIIIKGDVE